MKTIALFSVLVLAPMYSMSQSLAEVDNPQRATPKTAYLVIYRPGPGWPADKAVLQQSLKEHGKYLLNLYIKGSMKLSGPFTDDAGGAVLLTVTEEAEAKAIVANDPAVKSKTFVYELHPWKLQPWAEFAKKTKDAAQQGIPAGDSRPSGSDQR